MRHFYRKGSLKLRRCMCVMASGAMMLGVMSGCGLKEVISTTETQNDEEISEASDEFDESSKEVRDKTKEIEKYIDSLFYFEEDSDKREESYYDGIMKGLDDPYSVYYTKEEYEKLKEDDSGEFEGIGATVTKDIDSGIISIAKPLKDSPAEKAGVLPGDVIVQVDDLEITTDMELEFVVGKIRGEKGTDVELKIYRDGEDDYLTFTITRDTIVNTTVEYEMLDNDIGYIQIQQFVDNTPELFEDAIDDLEGQGAKGLVFDLRNNPGGLVSSVVEMVDYVIDDERMADGAETPGLILQTRDKDDKVMEEYKCSDGHSVDLPIAVIVNGNSASAAEIFAGNMQDYGVAEIVGTTTYGKGIVQSVVPLSDGSAIKLTIAQYFNPSGNTVHKVGITPDKEVELDEDQAKKVTVEHEDDNQLQEALKTLD